MGISHGTIMLPAAVGGLAALSLLFSGCAAVSKVAVMAGQSAGYINEDQAASIERSAQAMGKTFEDITPEQEYYIGRAVAATVLGSSYRQLGNKSLDRYVNLLGQTLARFSDRPETFGGYHFRVLDSDEANAFAAPGGLILVTTGMLRNCASEDALSAVLAHEIAHVAKKHGLMAIKKSRLTSALTVLAAEGTKNLAGDRFARLVEDFEGSISDITATLMNNGYARTLESEADREAVAIMQRAGYDPAALAGVLEALKTAVKKDPKHGFAKTHPDPQARIDEIGPLVQKAPATAAPSFRQKRFADAVAGR